MPQRLCERQRTLVGIGFLFTMWLSGIEPTSSGLEVGASTGRLVDLS